MDHTGGHSCLGPGRLDGLGQSPQAVAAHDQHLRDWPVCQVSARVRPERGTLLGLDPDAQDVPDTVHVHAHGDVRSPVDDPVPVADLDPDGVKVDHRVERGPGGRRCQSMTASHTASVILEIVAYDRPTPRVLRKW